MGKKNEKRLCWNCDGNVSLHLSECPYCGVDITQAHLEPSIYSELGSPFQTAPRSERHPLETNATPETPQRAPISNEERPISSRLFSVSEEEWNRALHEQKDAQKHLDSADLSSKKEKVALFLLVPGIIFSLFALALLFFSTDGILSLEWHQNLAYLYLVGATPLLYLGWRALR